ncbi:MAG: serine acetyltransferase [Kiritimatiellae bacterium]|jgi:serine O-acetyltransferase|nr:serine acetyltransferase [Kiritimatiellia bacterium]
MQDWINTKLVKVTDELEKSIMDSGRPKRRVQVNVTDRNSIYDILDLILTALFPIAFAKNSIDMAEINFFIGNTLRQIAFMLESELNNIFLFCCPKENCKSEHCKQLASQVTIDLIENLPQLRETLMLDVEAAYNGDPASKSLEEIILSYPCVEAIATYRVANHLYDNGVPLIPRIMTERAHSRTGIDINPGATIGNYFFIDHGTGVVIGETCTIGNHVTIYQGVTLGAKSPLDKNRNPRRGEKRHPDVEDNVIIYANSTILGGDTVIGENSIIGGNTWVLESVPPNSKVYSSQNNNKIKDN